MTVTLTGADRVDAILALIDAVLTDAPAGPTPDDDTNGEETS